MRPQTALVVEDDSALRDALVWLLQEEEHVAEGVSSSAAAEAALRARGPRDVLVVDLKLPDGDGEVLLQRLQDNGLLKVSGLTVMITASRRSIPPERGTLLRKPFTAPEFLELLSTGGADLKARPRLVVGDYGVFLSAAARRAEKTLAPEQLRALERDATAHLSEAIRRGAQFTSFTVAGSRLRVDCAIDPATRRVVLTWLPPARPLLTRS